MQKTTKTQLKDDIAEAVDQTINGVSGKVSGKGVGNGVSAQGGHQTFVLKKNTAVKDDKSEEVDIGIEGLEVIQQEQVSDELSKKEKKEKKEKVDFEKSVNVKKRPNGKLKEDGKVESGGQSLKVDLSKVVVLKGRQTERELLEQRRRAMLEQKAIKLTEKPLAKEQKEIKAKKKKDLGVLVGNKRLTDSVKDNYSFRNGVSAVEPGVVTAGTKLKKNVGGSGRTIVTPEGSIIRGSDLAQNSSQSKSDLSGVKSGKVQKSRVGAVKDIDGVVNGRTGKLIQTQNNTVDSDEIWLREKVDLSSLTSPERMNLQATPAMASVHWSMDDDTNGDLLKWFEKYNKLPVDVKLGLDSDEVSKIIFSLAEKFDLLTEEKLGEISRIVRDVYVDLLSEKLIRSRVVKNLKLSKEQLDDFLRALAGVVTFVGTVGKEISEKFFELMTLDEALEKYPKINDQPVVNGDIFDKKENRYVLASVRNFLNDYIHMAGAHKHSNLERAKYISESSNVKLLDEEEKERVRLLCRAYDEGIRLVVDKKSKQIVWQLHGDDSVLALNDPKNEKVINKLKIEESQKIDVDNFQPDVNLENKV